MTKTTTRKAESPIGDGMREAGATPMTTGNAAVIAKSALCLSSAAFQRAKHDHQQM